MGLKRTLCTNCSISTSSITPLVAEWVFSFIHNSDLAAIFFPLIQICSISISVFSDKVFNWIHNSLSYLGFEQIIQNADHAVYKFWSFNLSAQFLPWFLLNPTGAITSQPWPCHHKAQQRPSAAGIWVNMKESWWWEDRCFMGLIHYYTWWPHPWNHCP